MRIQSAEPLHHWRLGRLCARSDTPEPTVRHYPLGSWHHAGPAAVRTQHAVHDSDLAASRMSDNRLPGLVNVDLTRSYAALDFSDESVRGPA